jgi:pullulanase/glycogen debranching enzyme
MPRARVRSGEPFPLGASWDGRGTNFSIFSEVATRVELCLFDEHGHQTIVELPERTAFCWHGYLRGIGPGRRLFQGSREATAGARYQNQKRATAKITARQRIEMSPPTEMFIGGTRLRHHLSSV